MSARIDLESEYWASLARHEPLGILTDLDGTLLPFAATPDAAAPTADVIQLVSDLASLPNTTLAIVSGRPKEVLDGFFPSPRTCLLVAEHGAWRDGPSGWESTLSLDKEPIQSLAAELQTLLRRYPAALIERKTWSLALHFRGVPRYDEMGLLVQATAIIDPWLAAHQDFEDLAGAAVIEVRPRAVRKSNSVTWIKGLLGNGCRLLVVGDDVTDEDMFSASAEDDATVLVGSEPGRLTAARWRLESYDEVRAFYRWIVATRRGLPSTSASRRPSRVQTLGDAVSGGAFYDLLVLSNRLPDWRSTFETVPARTANVGGLVSALAPVMATRKALWLGWSGRTRADATMTEVALEQLDGFALAWVDFPEEYHRHYYNGMSNGALWPLLHSFPGRVKFSHPDWECYERANEGLAVLAGNVVQPDATVWVHDYHLLLVGKFLRGRGHRGPIGFFQHVPFPGPDIFFLLPWADAVLEAMLAFDLVGFHTWGYVDNFLRCVARVPGVRVEGQTLTCGDRRVRVGAFPLGIMPEQFQMAGDVAPPNDDVAGLIRSIGAARMVLGVDRLDYTKGIPERIRAFGLMLERFSEWRKNVCLVLVSVPSRADIPLYAEQRERVENVVGRINGEYGESDWVPIRYLYRSYGRRQLSQLYRAAHVGYVTPLRDGMNLVAKEYVAAQDPEKPGVLLLSRFAGAAEELKDALLTNPWDEEGAACDLHRALKMTLEERRRRHASLLAVISKTTALTWAEGFLETLAATTRS